jgi:hypothetical protein
MVRQVDVVGVDEDQIEVDAPATHKKRTRE